MSSPLETPDAPSPCATPDVAQVVDHLFRREAGRLVAILTRSLGPANLPLAEDVVQDALLRAMEVWPFTGVPENPSAWLLQTARNRAFDALRRGRTLRAKATTLAPVIEECVNTALAVPGPHFEDEIADAQLRMMFVCCQPSLPPEAQVALVLKTLCGFGEPEIAAAFLTTEAAIAKRLVRARQQLRTARVSTELPPAHELAARVGTVLHALYLLFNEGYKASHGDALLRADLCAEAIRLAELLAAQPVGRRPATHALLALLHFHAARFPTRTAHDGSLLLLADQDRSRWDRRAIGRGLHHLGRAAEGDEATRWHLEAGIAAAHVLAASYDETNWPHILGLYEALAALDPSPVVALNRTIALAHVHGPVLALQALGQIPQQRQLGSYYLFHAVKGHLLLESQRPAEATAALQRAVALAPQAAEREFLTRRLAAAAT